MHLIINPLTVETGTDTFSPDDSPQDCYDPGENGRDHGKDSGQRPYSSWVVPLVIQRDVTRYNQYFPLQVYVKDCICLTP